MASFMRSPSASPVPSSSSPGAQKNEDMLQQTERQDEHHRRLADMHVFHTGSDGLDYTETMSLGGPGSRAHSLSPSSLTVSPVAGVTIEHRMIADLRNQLDNQASENMKLRQQVEASTVGQRFSRTRLDTANPSPSTLGAVRRCYSDSHITSAQLPAVSETVESILARGSSRSPIHNASETVESLLSRGSSRSLTQNASDSVDSILTRGSVRMRTQNVVIHRESATEVLLKKQLSDAKAEITVLKQKLKQSELNSEQQRAQFRSAIEELQSRLNDTIVGRDSVLELRKRESEGQEKMLSQLQKTVKNLDSANRQHEKNQLEASQKINSLQQAASSSTAALQQIHSLLSASRDDANNRLNRSTIIISSPGTVHAPRSPSFAERDSGRVVLPPAHVVRLAEETLGRREARVRDLESALAELKREMAELKQDAEQRVRSLTTEGKEKLLHLSEEQTKQLEAMTERATNARQQAAGLQAQLAELQDQSAKQTSVMNMELSTLRTQYETVKGEAETERQRSRQKIDELTNEVETYNSNMSAAREEISSLQLKLADSRLTVQENKESLELMQTQLLEEQEKAKELRSQESQRLTYIQEELEARSLEVRHLEEMLAEQKVQATSKLQQAVFEKQCEEQKKAVDKTSQLLAQIESLTDDKNKLSLELQKKSAECEQSSQSRDSLTSTLEETLARLESLQGEGGNLSKQLAEKTAEMEVLVQERDHYQEMCMERARELDSAAALHDRLQADVAERERHYEEVIREKAVLTEAADAQERNRDEVLREKDHLLGLLEEKGKEVDEVSGLRDDLARKLKVRERRVHSLEEEVKTLTEAIQEKTLEVESVIEGKAGILQELRSHQENVTKLTKEREALETRLVEAEGTLEKSDAQQRLRIQALEHDLRLTLEALRATKSADARAVDVADSLHQELINKRGQEDSLKSALHGLEERLSSANKEKQELVSQRDLLEEKVSGLEGAVEKLQHKLQTTDRKRNSQKGIVAKLETALEKGALKHADAQQAIEKQEQTIAQMTLKHQLDVKALQRALATKISTVRNSTHATQLSPPPQPLPSQAVEPVLSTLGKKTQQQQTSSVTLTKLNTYSNKAVANRVAMPTTSTKKSSATGATDRSHDGSANDVASVPSIGRVGPVSAHFLQPVDGLVGRSYVSPLPVVVLNTSGVQGDSLTHMQNHSADQDANHNISGELKDLLEEVKTVFSANVAALKSANAGKPETARDIQSGQSLGQAASKPEDVLDPPLHTSSPYKADNDDQSRQSSRSKSLASSPPPPSRSKVSTQTHDFDPQGPPSPVSDLLGLHSGVRSDSILHQKMKGVNTATKVGQRTGRRADNYVNAATRRTASATTGPGSYSVEGHTEHVHTASHVNASKGETTVSGGSVNTASMHARYVRSQAYRGMKESASRQSSKKPAHSKVTFAQKDIENAPLPARDGAEEVGDFDFTRAGERGSVRSMNTRNRSEKSGGLGDVRPMATELIISDDDFDDGSSVTTVTSVTSGTTSDTGKPPSKNLSSLRDRLATLSQMGSQLQKGNTEMASLIKKQDAKLKRCRQEERQAKRIINSS